MKFKKLSPLVLAIIIPNSLLAMLSLEVKPKDVYQAAYCAELNRLLKFPKALNSEGNTKDLISINAAHLILGGDNLDFVNLGIEDAKREYLKATSKVEHINFDDTLETCAKDLNQIVDDYSIFACGFGRGSHKNASKAQQLLEILELDKIDLPSLNPYSKFFEIN